MIFEQPQPPTPDLPTLENPTLDNPTQEKPTLEKPTLENPTQLNKDIQRTDLPKKEKSNTDLSSTHSIPILSPNPSPCREAATPPERKGTEAAAQSAVNSYYGGLHCGECFDVFVRGNSNLSIIKYSTSHYQKQSRFYVRSAYPDRQGVSSIFAVVRQISFDLMNQFIKSIISWFAKINDCQANTSKKQRQHKLDSICYGLV